MEGWWKVTDRDPRTPAEALRKMADFVFQEREKVFGYVRESTWPVGSTQRAFHDGLATMCTMLEDRTRAEAERLEALPVELSEEDVDTLHAHIMRYSNGIGSLRSALEDLEAVGFTIVRVKP